MGTSPLALGIQGLPVQWRRHVHPIPLRLPFPATGLCEAMAILEGIAGGRSEKADYSSRKAKHCVRDGYLTALCPPLAGILLLYEVVSLFIE